MGHPEIAESKLDFVEALQETEQMIRSRSVPEVHLYYRHYARTRVSDKYLCMVVKVSEGDAFIIMADLTDSIKRGDIIWPRTR